MSWIHSDGRDDFFHDKPLEDDSISTVIRRLKALRRASHPKGGFVTAVDKDLRAEEAIRLAGGLFSTLAGWAVNHMIGAAVSNDGRCGRDDHRHEFCGHGGIDDGWTTAAVQRAVKALTDVVAEINGGKLSEALSNEMDAIIMGAKPILFSPQKHSKGDDPYRLWLYRERAVCQVYFLAASGHDLTEARCIVAKAYGEASFENVRTWENRLPTVFGARRFEKMIEAASCAAAPIDPETFRDCTDDEIRVTAEILEAHRGREAARFDLNAVSQDGVAYQKLRRAAKQA